MTSLNRQAYFSLLIFSLISFTGLFYQSYILINWDVSWGLQLAQRTLAGGTYFKDFFETNPPLVLYLYMPAVIFAKYFSISSILAVRFYIFTLCFCSLLTSYLLIKKIFSEKDNTIAKIFYLTIAFVLLIVPMQNFGQREHLLLILTIPYLLLVTCRLQNEWLNPFYAISIGLFAGIGFIIKPFFLMTFVLVELYCLCYKRNLFSWVRAEVLSVLFVVIAYLAIIVIFYQNYLFEMIPLISRFFYHVMGSPWNTVIFHPVVYFCCVAIVYFFIEHNNKYKLLSTVLFISLLGYLFSYIIQRTEWANHYYPAFAISILIFTLLFSLAFFKTNGKLSDNLFLILLGILIASYPIYNIIQEYESSLKNKISLTKIINVMKSDYGHNKIYFLSTDFNRIFPSIDYAHAVNASRFPMLFFVPGKTLLSSQNESFLVNMIMDDLAKNKPDLIFVDVKKYPLCFTSKRFDYIKYFSSNARFPAIWKNYRYFTTVEQLPKIISNPNEFHFYLTNNINNFDVNHIDGKAIILTGKNKHKIAYFVKNQQFVYLKEEKYTGKVSLSKSDLKLLQMTLPSGEIKRTTDNTELMNKIINNAILSGSIPIYKFDVYKRIG